MKLKVEGTPTISEWIGRVCGAGAEVGIDGSCSSASDVKELIMGLRQQGGITLRTNLDPLKQIWTGRPPIPENPVEVYPMKYAGERCRDKIARIRQALRERHADGMLMASLDDIAWTLNLRGTDVHCNPVFVSYLLISTTSVILYINKVKLTDQVVAYLKEEGVEVDDYEQVKQGLKDYFEYNILIDPDEVNYMLYQIAGSNENGRKRLLVEEESPVKRMKAVKNATEIAGFKAAMLRDGIAMVRFLKWLDEACAVQNPPGLYETEMSVGRQLAALRTEMPLFRDVSFDTIAGYGAHGAIVHYEATPETDVPLEPRGLLLLDSGAQYLDGTTDITRTIALGPLTDEERCVYTLVLKAHIQLELAKFPEGTTGTQIDALAREPLWRCGLNYLHGTGHGVGSYLCVHEGPHQIRMEWRPTPLVSGMTVTDEPGIYLAGRFGVRIENTLLVVPYQPTEFFSIENGETDCGRFLQFESLTLCPIDKRPIIVNMLTQEERDWLNDYHQKVFDLLSPKLDESERLWLYNATTGI
jgi:Xaa-Pro aminopeptidase